MMKERNSDKVTTEIILQVRFNEKDKRSKGKCPIKIKGNFQKFGGWESQNSKNSTCQRGERSCNKNDGQGNFRDEKKRFDKSKERCFKCQRFDHFTREKMQTRRNLKEMKSKLQDKSLIKRIHFWSWSHKEIAAAAGCGTAATTILGMLQKQVITYYMKWLTGYMQKKNPW